MTAPVTFVPAPTPERFRLALTGPERSQLAGLAEQLTGPSIGGATGTVGRLVDDPDWLELARGLSCRLPVRLREAIRAYRHDPGPDGTLLVRGLPIDPSRLPTTPTVAESVQRTATVPAAVAVLVGMQLGELVAYRDEKGGALVQDVLPVPGRELSQSNAGSVPLHLHVENAFHAARPDYVGLICLRNGLRGQAGTLVVSIRQVLAALSPADAAVLRQPRFLTAPPPSFHRGEVTAAHSVLDGCPDDPDICLDLHATQALDDRARAALDRLRAAMERAATALVLAPGEMALLDNRLVLHGRTRFTPRYDGQDRWLHRIYVHLDYRRSRALRACNGAVLV
jgi:L-asparagine oxygenase